MKRELTNKQKITLVIFLCVVFLGVTFVLLKFTVWSSTSDLKANNAQLKTQYDELSGYVINREQYEKDIVTNTKELLEIANNYDGDMTKKQVLKEFEDIFKEYNIESTSLSLNDNEVLDTIYVEDDNETKEFTYQKTPITFSYVMTYDNFDKFFNDIKEENKKISIDDISISPNVDDNTLVGTITISWATIKGNKEYKDPSYDKATGINSIFNGLSSEGSVN